MPNYYYLYNDNTSESLVLDTNVVSIDLPGLLRMYTVTDTFSDSVGVYGTGSYKAGTITLTKVFKKGVTGSAWGTVRYTFMKWLGQNKSAVIWFKIYDGTATMQCRVYPFQKSNENYKTLSISSETQITLQMEKAYFQKTFQSTSNKVLSDTTQQTYTITNSGLIRTSPVISFYPNTNTTLIFQCQKSTNYGFKLVGNFLAGKSYIYDCSTGIFTDNGMPTTGWLASGSIFSLDPGDNIIYVWGGPGALTISWYERYI